MRKEEIKEGILYLLQGVSPTGDGVGWTFLEIRRFLRINNIQGYFEETKSSWKRLKEIIEEMKNEGLIEERYFGEELNGMVDFSITQKGIDWIKGRDNELQKQIVKKWKVI